MNSKLDELLEKIFSNVNSWLNFAEAKNAANVAFVVACIAAIFSFGDMNYLMYAICIFLIVSGICSLLSFIPYLGDKTMRKTCLFFKKRNKRVNGDNLMFFEDIKSYFGKTYIEQVCKVYLGEEKYNPTKYQRDLSNEIVYNSHIASRKYKLFKVAVYIDIAAFLMFAICIVLA